MVLGYLVTACGLVVATGTTLSCYPSLREGARLLFKDAKSTYRYLGGTSTGNQVPAQGQPLSQNAPAAWILNDQERIGTRLQSLFSTTTIIIEVIKIYQGEQIRKELKGITDQLTIYNNLVAGGSSGPDGFARNVLDFFNLKAAEYTSGGGRHRFFIYHPDTHWHGAFGRIRQLPGSDHQSLLLGLSHDIFAVFRLMLCARVDLEEEMGNEARDITFHLLIPSYCSIIIPRSFVIVENLFPLTIDGQMAQGKLVWLNIPGRNALNQPVLNDVGNLDDLPESSWRDAAVASSTTVTATATWLVATPMAMNAMAIFCPPLIVPTLAGGFMLTVFATRSVANAVHNAWEAPPPALLG